MNSQDWKEIGDKGMSLAGKVTSPTSEQQRE